MAASHAMSNGMNGVHATGRQAQTPAELVGNQFVSQFYTVLHTNPQVLYRFYTDDSTLTHADGEDNSAITVKSQKQINDRVQKAGFQEATTQIWSVDSQYSKDDGVLVMVTGSLHCKGKKNRDFVQSFFLAVQDKGYFVLNDTFRYLASRTSTAPTPHPKDAPFHAQPYDKPAYAAPYQQNYYHQNHLSPHPASAYSAANGAGYAMPTPSPVAPQQSLPDRARGHAVTPSMQPAKPVGPPPPAPAQPALSHPTPPSPQPVAPPPVEAKPQESSHPQQPPPPPAPPAEELGLPTPISQPPKPIAQPPKPIPQPQQPAPQPKQTEAQKVAAPEQAAPRAAQPEAKPQEEAKAQQAPPKPAAPQKPAEPAAPLTYADRLKQGKTAPAKAPVAPKPTPTPAPVQQTQASTEAPAAAPAGKPANAAPETSTTNSSSPPENEAPNSTVFVKGMPEGTTAEKLEEAFSRFGAIKPKGVIIMKKSSPGADFAFVEFEEVAAMQAALEASVLLDGNKAIVKEKTGLGARTGGGRFGGGRGGEGRGLRGRGEGRGRNGPRGEGRFGGRGEGGRGEGREGGRPRSYSGNFQPQEGGKPPGGENLARPRPEGRGRGGRGGHRGERGPNPNSAQQQAAPQAA